jgi:thioredoxin-like negative regulator of GroEL
MELAAGLPRLALPVSAIAANYANPPGSTVSQVRQMDKIEGLNEILTMDPKNSFARYGLAMELAGRGDTEAALAEFARLLENDPENDPGYTAGYFMAAQTLANAGRTPEAIERLKSGILSAQQSGNHHALSEMRAMLDELDR